MSKMKLFKGLKDRKSRLTAVIAAAAALALLLIGFAAARYLYREDARGYIKAKEFYFTSNFLDGGEHSLAPGAAELSFTIGNHADELRYSEVDIAYTVRIDGTDASAQSVNCSGTLTAGSVQDVTVILKDLEPGTHTITAVGTGGYHKTLTATLIVPAKKQELYKYLDSSESEYVLLTVWSKGCEGDVTIEAPADLIPDNTDPVMAEARTGETIVDSTSFKDSGYCSHVYRFFGSAVSAENFTVTCGSVTAEIKAPQ